MPHFPARIPSGAGAQGPLWDLAVVIELHLQHREIGLAGTIALPGAVLRDSCQRRIVCLGLELAQRRLLTLALVCAGWSYEFDGWVLGCSRV